MTLAERLKAYRKLCGFSQEQIAGRLNINRSTYSYYELGTTQPSFENLSKLARIFGVTLDQLALDEPFAGEASHRTHFRDEFYDPDADARLDKLLGTSKIGDLTRDEKKLIISFRTLTDDQRRDIIEKICCYGLPSEQSISDNGKK